MNYMISLLVNYIIITIHAFLLNWKKLETHPKDSNFRRVSLIVDFADENTQYDQLNAGHSDEAEYPAPGAEPKPIAGQTSGKRPNKKINLHLGIRLHDGSEIMNN